MELELDDGLEPDDGLELDDEFDTADDFSSGAVLEVEDELLVELLLVFD